MRFRGSRKSLIAGLLLFALAWGTAGLLTWLLVKLRHDQWSGPLLLQLLLLAPAAVGFVLYVLKAWIDRMRAAFAWCELSPSVITVGGVFARREVAWSDVVDFELTPATFPRPPRQLVLVPRNGDPVAVPFSLRPEAEFRAPLQASFPPMADHRLERVRLARPAQVPSGAATGGNCSPATAPRCFLHCLSSAAGTWGEITSTACASASAPPPPSKDA